MRSRQCKVKESSSSLLSSYSSSDGCEGQDVESKACTGGLCRRLGKFFRLHTSSKRFRVKEFEGFSLSLSVLLRVGSFRKVFLENSFGRLIWSLSLTLYQKSLQIRKFWSSFDANLTFGIVLKTCDQKCERFGSKILIKTSEILIQKALKRRIVLVKKMIKRGLLELQAICILCTYC